MAEVNELEKVFECVKHYRLETIQLMNDPDTFLHRQREYVESLQKTLATETARLADYESRVINGGAVIDGCDMRMSELRNEIILSTRKALVERALQLVGLRKSLEQNDEVEQETEDIDEESIIS